MSRASSSSEKAPSRFERLFDALPLWTQILLVASAFLTFIFAFAFALAFALPPTDPDRVHSPDEPPRPACDTQHWAPRDVLGTLALLWGVCLTQGFGRPGVWWPRWVLGCLPVVMGFEVGVWLVAGGEVVARGCAWGEAGAVVIRARAESRFRGADALFTDHGQGEGADTERQGDTAATMADGVSGPHVFPPSSLREVPRPRRIIQIISLLVIATQVLKLRSISGAFFSPRLVAYLAIASYICVEIGQISASRWLRQQDRNINNNIINKPFTTKTLPTPASAATPSPARTRYTSLALSVHRIFWALVVWMQYVLLMVSYLINQEVALMRLLVKVSRRFSVRESFAFAAQFAWALPVSQIAFFTLLFLPFVTTMIRALVARALRRGPPGGDATRYQRPHQYRYMDDHDHDHGEADRELTSQWWADSGHAMWQFAAVVTPLLIAYTILPVGGTTEIFDNGIPPFAQSVPLQYNCTLSSWKGGRWVLL